MKRNGKLLLCLLLAALLLTACAPKEEQEIFPEVTQAIGPAAPTQVPQAVLEEDNDIEESETITVPSSGQSIFNTNPYDVDFAGDLAEDAMNEEDYVEPNEAQYAAYSPDTTVYPYAGATPIPLDPVDMPTPTPRPELTFSYQQYASVAVGVSFEAPVGWVADDTVPKVFTISEPDAQMKDGFLAVVTLSQEPVTSDYSEKKLKQHVTERLDGLYTSDYTEWKPSLTATRHMMGATGVYANYSATRFDGVRIGGRIQYVCIDKTLYGLEIQYPLAYKSDFENVFAKIRTTLKKN